MLTEEEGLFSQIRMIYILHAGTDMIDDAIDQSIYFDLLCGINPVIKNKLGRFLRRLSCSLDDRFNSYWIDRILQKNDVEVSDKTTFIVFDSPVWISGLPYLRDKYPLANIIFWYWNIVKDPSVVPMLLKLCDEVYTFDEGDSARFGLKHHSQFYWTGGRGAVNPKYDLLFVGRDKGRLSLLEDIYSRVASLGFRPYFYVVKDCAFSKSNIIDLKRTGLPYSELVRLICQSRAILDLSQEDQVGLTLRSLEAFFWGRKLITNNKTFKTHELYDIADVLVIDDALEINKDFFTCKYYSADRKNLDMYKFDSWLMKLVNSKAGL